MGQKTKQKNNIKINVTFIHSFASNCTEQVNKQPPRLSVSLVEILISLFLCLSLGMGGTSSDSV